MANFTWGSGGQIKTPAEAARQRAIAEALMPKKVADNPWEGIAQLAGGFTAGQLNNRATDAETQGQSKAGELFANLAMSSDPNSIIAALTSPDAQWASPSQTSIASALLSSGLERSDPAYQLDMQMKQAQLDALQNPQIGGASAPSNVQEWEYYSQLPPEQQSQYLTMKRSNSPLNIGTGFVTQDPANPGTVIGSPIAIDNMTPAYDTAVGTATGKTDAENTALATSVSSKMPGLRSVIDTLTNLADTATYTQSGQAMDSVKRELGLDIGQGAIDRATYIAIVDNQVLPLLKDTFGAAFTVSEGESLRATLGNPNASPAEKKAILESFIAQKERDVAAMQSQLPGAAPASNPGPQVSPNGVEYSF